MRKIHPLAEAIPRMTPEEYEELKADIKERGLLHRIILFEDKILDGRHRWDACTELGITPLTTTYDGDDPVGYVLSSNLMRRHLTREQIITAAGFLYEEQKKREGRPKKTGAPAPVSPERTAEKIAKQTGLNPRTVTRTAKKVREIKKADPELAEEVKAGKVTIKEAEQKLKLTPESKPDRKGPKKTHREIFDMATQVAVEHWKAMAADYPAEVVHQISNDPEELNIWIARLDTTRLHLSRYIKTLKEFS